MDYDTYSHRHGKIILEEPEFKALWKELKSILDNITDEDIIRRFPNSTNKMSISSAINNIISERMTEKGWLAEAPIFQEEEDTENTKRWRLDFAKDSISVEVAFNHGEAISWNLLKPVMASELNHVKKAIQTKVGIVILATELMKKAGAFDSSVGSYEKVIRYLKPMNNFLTVPMILIGLRPPETFKVEKKKIGEKNIGIIKRI